MEKKEYDAVVVGSGSNGLAAAITLQQNGCSVLLVEGKKRIGGGLRTEEFTLPGFKHDICSAIHPMALASPFFRKISWNKLGVEFAFPEVEAAHPLADGTAAVLRRSVTETARGLGADGKKYEALMAPLVARFPELMENALNPTSFPPSPLLMARFGIHALPSASFFARKFSTPQARGLWAGMAAHGIQPLENLTTAAIGLVLMAAGHSVGWPMAVGGSESIALALGKYFEELGGKILTDTPVSNLSQLPSAHAILFDVTPRQLFSIAGQSLSSFYKWQLKRYRYGMGVYKVDWALDEPIPFTAADCRLAGTVHLGNTLEEIACNERLTSKGGLPEHPFVLLAQQSLFDGTRAPKGKHTAWAYCHVPNGSQENMTERIEKQVERFAPGFRERIIGRHTLNSAQLESYNPNYIGGDINGGIQDIGQLFTRPVLRASPYSTSGKGIYICSSSTPPGGGVHGMCGYNSAKKVLRDVFGRSSIL